MSFTSTNETESQSVGVPRKKYVNLMIENATDDNTKYIVVPKCSNGKGPLLSPGNYLFKLPSRLGSSAKTCIPSCKPGDANSDNMSASKSFSLKEQAQTSSGGKKRNITSDLLHFKFVSLNEGRHKENYLEKKPVKNTESTFQNVNDTPFPPELDNGNSCLELSTAAALEAKFIKNQLLKFKCSFQLFCAGSLVFNTEPFPLTEVPSSFPIFFTNGQHPPLKYFNKKTVPPTTSCCLLLKPGKEIAAMMVENIVPGNYLLTELPPSTKTPGLGQAKGMRYDVVCATLTPYYFSVKDLWKGGRVLKLRHFTEKEHPQCLLPALRFDDSWFVDTDNIHDWLAACYPQCTHELYPLLHAASQSLIYRGRSRQNKKFNFRVQILSRRARKRKGRSIDGSSASHESVLDGFQ